MKKFSAFSHIDGYLKNVDSNLQKFTHWNFAHLHILYVVLKDTIRVYIYITMPHNSFNERHIVCLLIRKTFFAPNFHSINLPFQMKINLSGIKVTKKSILWNNFRYSRLDCMGHIVYKKLSHSCMDGIFWACRYLW